MGQIAIISENIIFFKHLRTFLNRKMPECAILQFSLFPYIKEKIDEGTFDLIVVDGIISGVGSFEIINYLRLEKKISSPICFFSDVRTDNFKAKAYESGVNYYYEKPFDPHVVTNDIVSSLLQIAI